VRSARITALEAEFPAALVDDAQLATELGLSAGAVAAWSRGRERRESPDGEGPGALAARAAARVLASRGLEAKDVEFLVFATNTPDMFFPGSACVLQASLPFRTIGSLDVRSQCTGFLAALDIGRRFVATGMFERVLVAAADTPSHFVRRDGLDPQLSCAMGDAAAVALVEGGEGEGEVLGIRVRHDGSRHTDWWCEFPASRHREGDSIPGRDRLPASKVAAGLHYPVVDLDRLRDLALERLPGVFAEALAESALDAVDATLFAHLDSRVEAEVPALLGAAAGRVEVPDFLYAGGASLPVLLARAKASGRVVSGNRVALLAAGAGATWGCGVVRVP
jgi:3-oxoacyl-[acyl-carrier-protein] synthase-3